MKANKLMLGDWVNYSHSEDGVAPFVEPTRIVPEDFGRDEDVFETHYHPIHLTPEILEKNGFEKTSCGMGRFVYALSDDYWAIAIGEQTDSVWRVEYINREANFPLCRVLVGYVHELQHCLTMFGIEKDITL